MPVGLPTSVDNPFGSLKVRLQSMAASGWNPLGDEAVTEIERLEHIIAAANETILEQGQQIQRLCRELDTFQVAWREDQLT